MQVSFAENKMKILWQFEERGHWKNMHEYLAEEIEKNIQADTHAFAILLREMTYPVARWSFDLVKMQQVREHHNPETDKWDAVATKDIRGLVQVKN